MTAARGLRNNNPGNIRHGEKWQGLADEQTDPAFCTFKSPQFGIRAMCRILLTYKQRGLTTVDMIINRWAPDSENDTVAYIDSVCAQMGVERGQEIDVDDTAVMRPLLKAIIKHENGSQPYSDAAIDDAMRLAGIANAKPIAAVKSPMIQGGTIAGITAFSYAGGTITTSAPALFTQTWNAAGVTFTGVCVNVTATASASGSKLQDWQVGGSSRAFVHRDGYFAVTTAASNHLIYLDSSRVLTTSAGGFLSVGSSGIAVDCAGMVTRGSRTSICFDGSAIMGVHWSSSVMGSPRESRAGFRPPVKSSGVITSRTFRRWCLTARLPVAL